MSDGVKWTLLITGAILVIGMVVALDIVEFIDPHVFGSAIATILEVVGDCFNFGRGIINNLLSPWARAALSALMYWIIGKELITWTIKVAVWVYHYIFK